MSRRNVIWVGVTFLLLIAVVAVGLFVFQDDAQDKRQALNVRESIYSGQGGVATRIPVGESTRHAHDVAVLESSILGMVVDVDRRPVSHAKVTALSVDDIRVRTMAQLSMPSVVGSAISGSDGKFSIGVTHGQEVTLRVEASGFATSDTVGCIGGSDVLVVLSRGSLVSVFTCDEEGLAQSGVRVLMWRNDDMLGDHYDTRELVTGHDGIVVFGSYPSGSAFLSCHAKGVSQPVVQQILIHDSIAAHVRVELPAGRVLRGFIGSAEDQVPLEGARVVGGSPSDGIKAVTDRAGRFALPGWIDNPYSDLYVDADGYARVNVKVTRGSETSVWLHKSDGVTGVIIAESGEPISGAKISVVGISGQEHDSQSGLTDTEGRFHISGLRRDMPHSLLVSSTSMSRLVYDFDPNPLKSGIVDLGTITLIPGTYVEGHVTMSDGRPLGQTPVSISGSNSDRQRYREEGVPAATPEFYCANEVRRTNKQGYFIFPDIAPGQYLVTVEPEGGPSSSEKIEVLSSTSPVNVTLSVSKGRILPVSVIDEYDSPLAGAMVRCVWRGGMVTARTKLDGQCRLFGVPDEEELSLSAHAERFLTTDPTLVEPGAELAVVRVKSVSSIRGVVLNEFSAPVPGIGLRGVDQNGGMYSSITDDHGKFALIVPQNAIIEIIARGVFRRGGGKILRLDGTRTSIRSPQHDVTVSVVSSPLDHAIAATVVDGEDHAVHGAVVEIRESDNAMPCGLASTDEHGVAFVRNLPRESLALVVRPPASRDDLFMSSPTLISSGVGETRVVLRSAHRVSGTVVLPDGVDFSDVAVGSNGTEFSVRTNESGEFSVRVPQSDVYTIRASIRHGGQRKTSLEIKVPADAADSVVVSFD